MARFEDVAHGFWDPTSQHTALPPLTDDQIAAAERVLDVRFLNGIGPPGTTGRPSLLDTPYLVNERGLPTSTVLLYGEGHYWVALDYRASGTDGEPSVTWIDNEMEHELALAQSFRTFVEQLTSGPVVPNGPL